MIVSLRRSSGLQRRMYKIIAQVQAPHFTAGLTLYQDVVEEAAPIINYMKGWSRDRVREYCRKKQWKVFTVDTVLVKK